ARARERDRAPGAEHDRAALARRESSAAAAARPRAAPELVADLASIPRQRAERGGLERSGGLAGRAPGLARDRNATGQAARRASTRGRASCARLAGATEARTGALAGDASGERRVMSAAPRVSVVMGVRDGEAALASTVASVLSQEGPALELIVVDDGSTDGTG